MKVGSDPDHPMRTAGEWHAHTLTRAGRWPRRLLATATPHTKFGEDTRARINVLSELPAEWRRELLRWRRMAAMSRGGTSDIEVDANDAYRFFQAIAGTWPFGSSITEATLNGKYADRMADFMRKSAREAKIHTSWLHP